MVLRSGKYFDGGMRNRMLILVMYRIIQLHDSVYMFNGEKDVDELVRLKNYLHVKFKRRALI